MDTNASDLWTAGGVLLGFQVSALWWRVQREVTVSKTDIPIRISPADYLNLLAMVVLTIGAFVVPTLTDRFPEAPVLALGLSSILFVGHGFGLVGHYGLFNPGTPRPGTFFPSQERVAVLVTLVAAAAYLILALRPAQLIR